MMILTYRGKCYNIEYSVVNISELEKGLRLDAEYYDPSYLKNEKRIKRKKWDVLGSLFEYIGSGKTPKRYSKDGKYTIVRSGDLTGNIINKRNLLKTNETRLFRIFKKDILISSIGRGSIGKVAINLYDEPLYTVSEVTVLRNCRINPFYVAVYLQTPTGQREIERRITGATGQLHLIPSNISTIAVPIPSNSFQKFIEKLVLKAYEEREKSDQLYIQAKEILSEKLGIKNWKPKTKKVKIGGKEFEVEENISIRRFSDVVQADRLDAEYWEPKYDELEQIIKSFKHKKLHEIASNSYETFNPKNCDYFYYLEIANVDLTTGIYELKKVPCSEAPSRAKKLVEEKDILISTVRPNRNAVAFVIKKDKEPFVASTGFCKLKVIDNRVLPEYLFVLFKTDLYRELLVRKTTATMYPAVSEKDIMELEIPILPMDIQERIRDMIIRGFQSRENSKKLLEIAKQTVELYIENNEKVALEYAQREVNSIGVQVQGCPF
ncbi:putative Restriction endonuclease S subunit [Thermococcus nautili]|uniref:restriction endonuclease subunit S n=1 Tax=Thermococcus nautili TaxID=195522 RepID=UPI002557C1C5|nr:restriction endonuclease subunit S [Thermococcus nautili]CAI1493618.1 putative Restriction endonuclease S subunit [Thermococcus nautili]